MFWLLVFLVVLGTLAYRALPLATSTGVLGVTVLLYGWLGESAGHFLLLLLVWLGIFVPLNVVALRQEWFSRPLLDRWRAQLLAAGAPPDPGSAALLLDGQPGPVRAHATDSELPDGELRAEALAAAIAARLRQPLRPMEPQTEQAEVAELLYLATALTAQEPRLLAQELPSSALLVRAGLAWPLASAAARLRGRAVDARLDWAALAPEHVLATRIGIAHRGWRVLQRAVHLDSPAERLVAFDLAVWPQLGQLLSEIVRSFVGSLIASLPLPADGEDGDRRRQRRLTLASQQLGALLRLRLVFGLQAPLPPAFDRQLASAVQVLLGLQAALAWQAAGSRPGSERPLVASLAQQQRHGFEQALASALRELPQPLWRHLLRVLLLPAPLARPATATERHASAEILLREPALRARLAAGLPAQAALQALDERLESLRALEPTLRRLRLAHFEPPPTDDAALLASAERLGLLSEAEVATLSEALDFAQQQLNPESA